MPRIPIAQLGLHTTLRKQAFLLRERSLNTTRSGTALLRVTLGDRTGSLPGVMFDASPYLYESLEVGQGVEVTGRVEEFRGSLQIKLEHLAPTELVALDEYLPTAQRPMDEMRAELDGVIHTVRHPDLRRLLDAILGDKEIYKSFTQAPAAKSYHHACLGGLLEHTLAVVRIVLAAHSLYPEMDHDVALTVALLHDLGKITAYDQISFDLTKEGSLWSHLYMSASMVEQAIDKLEGFDPELRLRVVHGILGHHGRLEYGSPVVPMTVEAMVIHHADALDADARGAIDQYARGEGEAEAFTEYSNMHATRLYRGADGPADPNWGRD